MHPQRNNHLKYCENTTTNHSFVSKYKEFLSAIKTLLEEEGIKKCLCPFHKKHAVLNLDKTERAQGKHALSPTCDFTFGVSTAEKNRKMVLVECKFNLGKSKIFDTTFKENILNKIKYSKSFVGAETPFFKENIVLIEPQLYQQGKNNFNRLFQGNKNSVIPLTVSLFYDKFFV
jgi:hypothetical protein